jgi:hypothetical protein
MLCLGQQLGGELNEQYIRLMIKFDKNQQHYIVENTHKICIFIRCVITLALGLQPRRGLTKVQAKNELGSHISHSHECNGVRGNEPPHSQVSSHFGS